jgi:CheY-like chemotaxis protein
MQSNSPPRGGISFRARTLAVAADTEMAMLHVEVQDSGPGISPKQMEHIFEPFHQAGRSPSYLNLMGGEIGVDSIVGKGSHFHLEVPVVLVKMTHSPVVGLAPEQPQWRILIAEDNLENQLLLQGILEEIGLDVRVAEDGDKAVTLFQEWKPHFIWMDMRMPIMDGYEATKRIRALQEVEFLLQFGVSFRGNQVGIHKPYKVLNTLFTASTVVKALRTRTPVQ